MEGHSSGAEDVGQKSSKNREQEIKETAVVKNLSGFGSQEKEQPASPTIHRSFPQYPQSFCRSWDGVALASVLGFDCFLHDLHNNLKQIKILNIMEISPFCHIANVTRKV